MASHPFLCRQQLRAASQPAELRAPVDHSLPLAKQLALDCFLVTEQIFNEPVNELAM